MSSTKNTRRGSLLAAAAVVLLVAAGASAIGYGLWGNTPPPQPPAAAAIARTSDLPTNTAVPAPTTPAGPTAPPTPHVPVTVGPILKPSTPTRIQIPAIGVDSDLMKVGQNKDGTIQVPPLGQSSPAGWYKLGPTPGEVGPAVILGHVDSYDGHSVFYSLGDMRQGDKISVTRADKTVAVFKVERIAKYSKAHFPQLEVYGNTNRAELRLITCGGVYNKAIGHYNDNIVVYAALISSHKA